MGKIVDIKVIEEEYGFQASVLREVKAMQDKGYVVEIQYSTTAVGGFHSIRHCAMITAKYKN